VEEAATRTKLPPGQVRALVALHRDAPELNALKQGSLPGSRGCAHSLLDPATGHIQPIGSVAGGTINGAIWLPSD
jgi:hypothetical protein